MKTRTISVAIIWPVNMSAETERKSGCDTMVANVEMLAFDEEWDATSWSESVS
jgi:hypothetical protein